ncbi:putative periplasmic lipoprotein [Tenacibaculum skagerrakense]|uniref:hypothetical protein n=1 Tax=Tenacibaculum skagerrakense TaxID=186571 RepID=UPI0014049C08|nr:hypothetical protein [Tenacibaculum skagerrakense]
MKKIFYLLIGLLFLGACASSTSVAKSSQDSDKIQVEPNVSSNKYSKKRSNH